MTDATSGVQAGRGLSGRCRGGRAAETRSACARDTCLARSPSSHPSRGRPRYRKKPGPGDRLLVAIAGAQPEAVNEPVLQPGWLEGSGTDPVAEMVDLGDLAVTVEVPESYYAGLAAGGAARVDLAHRGVAPRRGACLVPPGHAEGHAEGRAEGLIGQVRLCERFLKRTPLPDEQLKSMSEGELQQLLEELESQLPT